MYKYVSWRSLSGLWFEGLVNFSVNFPVSSSVQREGHLKQLPSSFPLDWYVKIHEVLSIDLFILGAFVISIVISWLPLTSTKITSPQERFFLKNKQTNKEKHRVYPWVDYIGNNYSPIFTLFHVHTCWADSYPTCIRNRT